MRKKAANEFEKDFYKLMNNAVFGKTMEFTRKRIKMEVVSGERKLQKLINRTTFKYCTDFKNENLTAVTLENKIIDFCKPIYIGIYILLLLFFFLTTDYNLFIITGFAVLDVSKSLMYDYHYNVMQAPYKEAIQLMYTDT
ncbi:uncharacterized protein LOC112680059, partial [Sipha flava]|uniref:Uncharacterized protein LOC112680059 n=1 Tax=Sipha flava TaxID=143950 RepID=A0A8B8F4V8_9HEMI